MNKVLEKIKCIRKSIYDFPNITEKLKKKIDDFVNRVEILSKKDLSQDDISKLENILDLINAIEISPREIENIINELEKLIIELENKNNNIKENTNHTKNKKGKSR
jgi:uncharacterized protein YfkK (UPF0435 family)